MSYLVREIDVTIHLGKGAFGNSGFDTVSLTGLRVAATITKAGGLSWNSADIRIYGVPLAIMNQLSTLGLKYLDQRNNTVTLTVGDSSGKAIVFVGTIQDGYADFGSQPEVAFHIFAVTAGFDRMKPVPPTSYKGATDVVTIISGMAAQAGYNFTNNGVTGVVLSNPYHAGTIPDQIKEVARAAGINVAIDDASTGTNQCVIWPKGGSRAGSIPTISPASGLIGYPTFNSQGITFKTLFNPAIGFGATIQMQSSITPACGNWDVIGLVHELESITPGGQWTTVVDAARVGSDAIHT